MIDDIQKKILDKIQEENITPKPRWNFLLKEYVLWSTAGVSVIVGGLAVSVIIHRFATSDLDFIREAEFGTFRYVMSMMPYFWVVLLAILAGIIYYNIVHTEKGYHYRFSVFFMVLLSLTLMLGVILHLAGVARMSERLLLQSDSSLLRLAAPKPELWMNPDDGMLVGMIIETSDGMNFQIKDIYGEEWEIIVIEGADVRGDPHADMFARMIGEQEDEYIFRATKIRLREDSDDFFPHKPYKQGKQLMKEFSR
ncbi:MAG: hypothetical protein Q8P90_05560 [bacterium]|nr:hypothetical protein [bacterium]